MIAFNTLRVIRQQAVARAKIAPVRRNPQTLDFV
jgi:hypothetical protein